ncbi:MAG: DUF6320 domain-containing protein [Bacilli bacterium]
MKKCNCCKVDVITTDNKCPLCQKKLVGKCESLFPKNEFNFKKHDLAFKIIIVIGLFTSIVCFLINIIFKIKPFFSIYVFLAFIYLLGFLYIAIKKRSNPSRAIIKLVNITSLFAILFDLITSWHEWSISYVIPIILIIAIIVMSILSIIGKLLVEDFIGYFMLNIIYGLIPIFFILTGIVKMIIPSFICVIVSLFFFIFLFIFEGKNMKTELKRRLHI